ncbi:probable carbohydrate esterase At4g34215 isoform X2 [Typha angustifolia]|uniref:probable carbohydrate esterase At4g34215 isoform X2 n=1 Tax=Typha angustifolia TaxID=59011 RepID=UPI003C2EC8ED
MLPLLPLLLLLASSALLAIPHRGAAADTKKLVFVLAGQSNMAGRGGVARDRWDHIVPRQCRPTPSVIRLSASLRWEVAAEPLHADVDFRHTCGVGPGLAFAEALRSSVAGEGELIRLVPCAVGGTRIEEWEKGRELYEEMVRRARKATAAEEEEEEGGRIGAVLWYQGESDTVYQEDAESYGGRMERMIRDLRDDLGLPGLLVIQVAIASGEGPFIDIVREAQKGIKLPNVRCVDAKGLALEADHLHLTTHAQVKLGEMLAESYLTHGTEAVSLAKRSGISGKYLWWKDEIDVAQGARKP